MLPLPPRAATAPSAGELLPRLAAFSLADREREITAHVRAGNVPAFLRTLQPVTVIQEIDGRNITATFLVAPDYLAIGSDADYFLAPLSPVAAQKIADDLGCLLPTRKMVDAIKVLVDGIERDLPGVLADPKLCALFSDEGPVTMTRYSDDPFAEFAPSPRFGEQMLTFTHGSGARICIVAPAKEQFTAGKLVQLVFYALPNGNTIEQTLGRKIAPGDDWHFDIQHIAAQTRLVRERLPGRTVVLVCLEARGLSWPAWRKQHGDAGIPAIIDAVRRRFAAWPQRVTLSGHSGGGGFIFGWLNASPAIPGDIERIAFLDATYAFDPAKHADKLAAWLAAPAHFLCVLAYRDDVVRLDGKPVVSATGGAWFRSRLMRDTLAKGMAFTHTIDGDFESDTALDGRVQFRLHTNPAAKILHTVQVEKNGFIHSLLSGTLSDEIGYRYFGPRAYTEWISEE